MNTPKILRCGGGAENFRNWGVLCPAPTIGSLEYQVYQKKKKIKMYQLRCGLEPRVSAGVVIFEMRDIRG